MKVSIWDRDELASLEPRDLSLYLQSKGWERLRQDMRNAEVWIQGKEEVLLPTERSVGDYSLRMSQLLHSLEQVEQRSQLDIVRDIWYVAADVVRVRRSSENHAFGTIPLADGHRLVAEAVEMVTAAACTAVAPRRVIPTRHPAEADAYLDQVRLGHTERGSFILTIVSRVTPLMTPGVPSLLELMEEPFARRVTRTLWDAVGASNNAVGIAREGESAGVFEATVERGVSANLCEALAGMLEAAGGQADLSLSVVWAASQPLSEWVSGEHRFLHGDIPILQEAARLLKQSPPLEGIPVTGVVVKLHREKGTDTGDITVSCVIEGVVRKLSVALSPSDYETAIEAHRDKRGVYFRANVAVVGRHYRASEVSGFRMVDE